MKSNGNRYTVKEWAKWKADYESGKYESLQELRKSCVKAGIKAPSHRAFQERAAKEHWDKNKNQEILQKTIADKNIQLFAELGKTTKDFAGRVINGAFQDKVAIRDLRDRIQKVLEAVDPNEPTTITFAVNEIIELWKECGDTSGKCLGWVQEANKLMGTYAPTKKELTGPGGSELGIFGNFAEDEINRKIMEKMRTLGIVKPKK